jgi:hypothetical protein
MLIYHDFTHLYDIFIFFTPLFFEICDNIFSENKLVCFHNKGAKKMVKHVPISLMIVFMVVFGSFMAQPRPVQAALDTNMVTINGGGGVQTDGSDGIMMTFNISGYGEQVKFINENFIYSGGDVSFHLNVGGTLYTAFRG